MGQIILPGQNAPPKKPKTGDGIELQNRRGEDIENVQAWQLTRLDWKASGDLRTKFAGVRFLVGPCPVYNCHGLSLASRRTQLSPDTADFYDVLMKDGFKKIPNDLADVGDVILYYNDEDGGITHSGVVVAVETFVGSGEKVPKIWSKWGKGPEVVHCYNMCPYMPATVQYFRMQSWEDQRHA